MLMALHCIGGEGMACYVGQFLAPTVYFGQGFGHGFRQQKN